MPECYTHVQTAMHTLMRSGHTVASFPAFIAGANGPAPLFMFRKWNKKGCPNLPYLAQKIQKENTGAFLMALARYASTPQQQSYALGFITHYTTSCTLSPYIAAMSGPNGAYPMPSGQYLLAAAIDSDLYYRDYKTHLVPLTAGTPVLITNELAQVVSLLHSALLDVYDVDVPLLALSDAFHDNMIARKRMISRFGFKKFMLKVFGQKPFNKDSGPMWARTQPAAPLRTLPHEWTNPYTGDVINLTLPEVLTIAAQTGAVCVTAAMRYWLGSLEETKLEEVLGSNDYFTGLPCKGTRASLRTAPQQEMPLAEEPSLQT